MKRAKQVTIAVLILLVIGVGVLFFLQNRDTQVVLYLDLLVWRGKLENPASVPLLMFASFAAGLAVMGAYTLYTIFTHGRDRRARRDYGRAMDDHDRDDEYDDYDERF